MNKNKLLKLLISIFIIISCNIQSYAYTKMNASYGEWKEDENGRLKYGKSSWNDDGTENTEYLNGIWIIDNTVYEFDGNGIYIDRNQKYYKDKFQELYTAINLMNDIITMPKIDINDTYGFWASFNNRLCGSSSGIQYLSGEYLNCTNLDEMKFAMDRYSTFINQSRSYISSLWNNSGIKNRNGSMKELKDATVDEILKCIQKDIHTNCSITDEGSRPMYVYTGSSSISKRDVSVAIASSLCSIGIPAITCSSISTGELYVCVYNSDKYEWEWCDFTNAGEGTYIMSNIPTDLEYYY